MTVISSAPLNSEEGQVKVSIIIPVYEDVRIQQCLAAIQKQTYPKHLIEVIVVDNGRKKIGPFHGVLSLVEPVPGSYRARNRGVDAATGEILAFTDADCLPVPEWVEEGVKALASNKNVDAVGGEIRLFARDMKNPNAAELYELVWGFPQIKFVESKGFAATANLLVTKESFLETGPFNENLFSGGDQEWGERVTALGKTIVYSPSAIVSHPARESLLALTRKYIRTFGGQYQLRNNRNIGHRKALIKLVKKPFIAMKADIGYKTSAYRLRYVAVHCLLSSAQIVEYIRLSLGGKPSNL